MSARGLARAIPFGNGIKSNTLFGYTPGILVPTGGVFTRASSATYRDVGGVTQTAGTGVIRDAHYVLDPVSTTFVRTTLLEGQRTNVFLNSAVGVTQSIAVTAQVYTLSFYGTGTITLSGVSVAGPLVGTGASNRVTLTFTPTAGSLTLTVTGSCTSTQLEAGGFVSSYIATTGSTVTRAADALVFPYAPLPQTITAYVRFIEGGTSLSVASARLFQIGVTSGVDAFLTYGSGGSFISQLPSGNSSVFGPAIGHSGEVIAEERADGNTRIGISIDGAAIIQGALSASGVPLGAYADQHLGIGCNNVGTENGFIALRDFRIFSGIRDVAYCRSHL